MEGALTDDIVFANEKLFTVEAKLNYQNDRALGKSLADITDSRTICSVLRQKVFAADSGVQFLLEREIVNNN